MNNVRVKICGIRTLEAAITAVDAGADFLGFNFVPTSKRYIDPAKAKEIIAQLQGNSASVGVFENMPLDQVQAIIQECHLDVVQFHGNESHEYIAKVDRPLIKAFRLEEDFDFTKAKATLCEYRGAYCLVDRMKQSEGSMLNRKKVAALAKEFHIVFAGGLTPENVVEVMREVKPAMVDVASGVETNGQQDLEKIKLFIHNAKGVTV